MANDSTPEPATAHSVRKQLLAPGKFRLFGRNRDWWIKQFFEANATISIVVLLLIVFTLFREASGFIPGNLNTSLIDEVIQVANEDALATAQALAQQEGLPAGISTGANVWAAIQVAKRPEFKGKRIVTVGCSSTERYLSTPLAEKVREEVSQLPVHEI